VRAVSRVAAVVRGEDSGEDGLAVGHRDWRVVVVVMIGIVKWGGRRRGRHDIRHFFVEEQWTLEGALLLWLVW
jgi:hypothetical protein